MGKKRKKRKKKSVPPGKVPFSQAISTYGVGSIYELRRHSMRREVAGSKGTSMLHSVMMMGLDYWQPDGLETLYEPVLQQVLGVRHFKLPPAEEEDLKSYIPSTRFPRWLTCNKCKILGVVGTEFDDRGVSGPKCNATNCTGKGIPTRLVSVCYSREGEIDEQPGHIQDFPWVWWAHQDQDEPCDRPALKLEVVGNTTSISGLIVKCYSPECKEKEVGKSLEGVFGDRALYNLNCFGNRPWLNDQEGGCKRKIRTVLRGASNVYFSLTVSAISIPPYSEELLDILQKNCPGIIENVIDADNSSIDLLVGLAMNSMKKYKERYSVEEVKTALLRLGNKESVNVKSEEDIRAAERKAIIEGRKEDFSSSGEFVAVPASCDDLENSLSEYFSSLVQVTRLREVRVLRGFTRVVPPSGSDPFQQDISYAPLSKKRTDWLPGIEVKGEGLYFELGLDKLQEWKSRAEVQERYDILKSNYERQCKAEGPLFLGDLPGVSYVLVHTLSHLIIKQLSLQCGYSSASLRERIYVKHKPGLQWAGVLIYTANTGSDGTLGGLVRQGKPDRFSHTVISALESTRWCSSDPLCMESEGQGLGAMNLASCHACGLISETSCESRNILLDRALLLGTPDHPQMGFFSNLDFKG